MISRLNETAVLDATVASLNLELQSEIEVIKFSSFPNNEGVASGRIALGGLANDCSILCGPKLRVAVPTIKGLAVKDHLALIGKNKRGDGRKKNYREKKLGSFHGL